jgi:hypothetical protein
MSDLDEILRRSSLEEMFTGTMCRCCLNTMIPNVLGLMLNPRDDDFRFDAWNTTALGNIAWLASEGPEEHRERAKEVLRRFAAFRGVELSFDL